MIETEVIKIIEDGIRLLPQIVLYIVPGYISLSIYYISRDKVIKEDKLLIVKSIFLSYIYTEIVDEIIKSGDILRICLISLLAVIIGLLSNWVLHTRPVKFIMRKVHHTTLCSNIIDEIQDIGKEGKGIYIRAYMKDDLIVYEGYLIRDIITGTNKHYIILDCYRKDTIQKVDEGYKKYHVHQYDNEHERCVVIDYNDIKYFEIKYDELQHNNNLLN